MNAAIIPDLPGWASTGGSIAEVQTEISAAIRFHLEGLGRRWRTDSQPQLPGPCCRGGMSAMKQ